MLEEAAAVLLLSLSAGRLCCAELFNYNIAN